MAAATVGSPGMSPPAAMPRFTVPVDPSETVLQRSLGGADRFHHPKGQ